MKRILTILALTLAAVAATGCLDTFNNDLDVLERRIQQMEEKCEKLNSQMDALRQMISRLEEYDLITKVESVKEGSKVIGYKIYFTHASPITLINGTDAETPVMGVAKAEDGVYYWTVRYPGSEKEEFVLNNRGEKIPASANSPELKIENGYWFVTYDGGKTWQNLGKATADDGASFFSSVEERDGWIVFKLLNGTELKIPTWSSYEKLRESCDIANKNLVSFTELAQALQKKVYATDIQPIQENGQVVGYRLFLSDGTSYPFYNGVATNAPVIGSAQDPQHPSDPSFYWTIQYSGQATYSWLLDDKGQKIRADASQGKPVRLTILPYGNEGKYYWAVAYGDGEPQFLLYNGEKVEANATAPDGVVTMVVTMEDNRVFIRLSDKQNLYVPLAPEIVVTLDSPVVSGRLAIAASESIPFVCHIPSATKDYEVLPVTRDGFYAVAVRDDLQTWTITLTAPATFAAPATSELNLLVSNGTGAITTITVSILHK